MDSIDNIVKTIGDKLVSSVVDKWTNIFIIGLIIFIIIVVLILSCLMTGACRIATIVTGIILVIILLIVLLYRNYIKKIENKNKHLCPVLKT